MTRQQTGLRCSKKWLMSPIRSRLLVVLFPLCSTHSVSRFPPPSAAAAFEADKAAAARVQSRQYARVWAHESEYTDADLALAYRKLVVDDDIKVFRILKDLAYNQVLSEMDCDPAAAYPEGRWHRFVSLIA